MANTRFQAGRVWDDAGLTRLQQKEKSITQQGRADVEDFRNQQGTKIAVLKASAEADKSNYNFAVNDFIEAYKRIVDERAKSWKAWGKLLTQDVTKQIKNEIDAKVKEGAAKGSTLNATGVQRLSSGVQPVAPSQGEVDQDQSSSPIIVNSDDGTSSTPTLTKSDVVHSTSSSIAARTAEITDSNPFITNYERARIRAGVQGFHQERGFMQSYITRQAGNINQLVESYLKGKGADIELTYIDENNQQVVFTPSQLTLDSPETMHLAAREFATREILGEMLSQGVNGVTLKPEFVADKVFPILAREERIANKQRHDATRVHLADKEISLVEKDLYLLSSGLGAPNQDLGSLLTRASSAFKLRYNDGTSGAQYKRWLGTALTQSLDDAIKTTGSDDVVKEAWKKATVIVPWEGGGTKPVPLSQAFPGILTDEKINSASIERNANFLKEVKTGMKNDGQKMLNRYSELLREEKFGEAANVKAEFEAQGYHIHFNDLYSQFDRASRKILKGEAGENFLTEHWTTTGEMDMKTWGTVSTQSQQLFRDKNPNFKDSMIVQHATGKDPTFTEDTKTEIDTALKLFDAKSKTTNSQLGKLAPDLNGTIPARLWFTRQLDVEARGIRGTPEGRLLSEPQLYAQARENLFEKIAVHSEKYKTDKSQLTPFVLDSVDGWAWHAQNQEKKNLSIAKTALDAEELAFNNHGDVRSYLTIGKRNNLPESYYDSDQDGSVNDFWISVSNATAVGGKRIDPVTLMLANAKEQGVPVELDGDLLSAQELSNELIKRINKIPPPDSKELTRELTELNGAISLIKTFNKNRFTANKQPILGQPYSNLIRWGGGSNNFAPRPINLRQLEQRQKILSERQKVITSREIFEFHEEYDGSGMFKTKLAVNNATAVRAQAEQFNVTASPNLAGALYIPNEYNKNDQVINFATNSQAAGFGAMINDYYRFSGEKLTGFITGQDEVIPMPEGQHAKHQQGNIIYITTENATQELLAFLNPENIAQIELNYGWRLEPVAKNQYRFRFIGVSKPFENRGTGS